VLSSRAWAAYLVAAAIGEALLSAFPTATAAIDASVLVAALSQFGWAQRSPLAIGDPSIRVLPAVALLPLMRLLSLTMPAPALVPISWVALAGAPLLLAVSTAARLAYLTVRDMGLATPPRGWLGLAVIAVSIPVGLCLAPFVPAGVAHSAQSPVTAGLAALGLVACAAIPEELIFRGVLQPLVVRRLGSIGVVLVAVVHATTYAGTGSALVMALMGGMSLVYGLEVARSGSLWPPLVGHSLLTVCSAVVAPLVGGLAR
jgi:membrane protease YdiL (CAAX protease family)